MDTDHCHCAGARTCVHLQIQRYVSRKQIHLDENEQDKEEEQDVVLNECEGFGELSQRVVDRQERNRAKKTLCTQADMMSRHTCTGTLVIPSRFSMSHDLFR